MKHPSVREAIVSLMLFRLAAGAGMAEVVITTFDDGTMGGWSITGDAQAVSVPLGGGNPCGYLRIEDKAIGEGLWIVAPPAYLGNWHGREAVSADLKQFSFSGSYISPVKFEISGPGGKYTRSFANKPPLYLWQTFGTPLDETLWTRNSGSWNALLDDVRQFRICVEFISGAEVNGIDNIALYGGCTVHRIGEAKALADDTCVTLAGIVTRVLDDAVYIQEVDRSSGIRLNSRVDVSEGDRMTVTGLLSTVNNERVLQNPAVAWASPAQSSAPMHTRVRDLGGVGTCPADPPVGSARGLKETGLLVSVSGRVSSHTSDGCFELDDGSPEAVRVRLVPELGLPVPGSHVWLTGVSGVRTDGISAPMVLGGRDVRDLHLPLNANILRNPGAEEGPSGTGGVVRPVPGWAPTSNFTVADYGSASIPAAQGPLIEGGRSFFYGGNSTMYSDAVQTIDISEYAAQADAGLLRATLSGDLAGYSTQRDTATVVVKYLDESGGELGTLQIGPQAGSNQQFIFHQQTGAVPALTRRLEVRMISVTKDGSNNNGYFDKLSLILRSP